MGAPTAGEPPPDGLAVVDKPAGWTSHDVVAKARGVLHTRKIGHSGTLDPDATGVLLLGVGRATRLLRFLTALPKHYVGDIVLGVETTTLDAAGEVTATYDMASVTLDEARAAAATLTGDIMQVPPMVSAIQIGGRRMHELAREGIEVERAPRPVTVGRFDLRAVPDRPGVLRAEVDCSSGTYVRSLAADLGRALGGGAHLRDLRRTAIGSYSLSEAHPLDDLQVLPIEAAVRDMAHLTVDAPRSVDVRHGKVLERSDVGVGPPGGGPDTDGPWAVIGPEGVLLAVYEAHRGTTVKPAVVVAAPGDG